MPPWNTATVGGEILVSLGDSSLPTFVLVYLRIIQHPIEAGNFSQYSHNGLELKQTLVNGWRCCGGGGRGGGSRGAGRSSDGVDEVLAVVEDGGIGIRLDHIHIQGHGLRRFIEANEEGYICLVVICRVSDTSDLDTDEGNR